MNAQTTDELALPASCGTLDIGLVQPHMSLFLVFGAHFYEIEGKVVHSSQGIRPEASVTWYVKTPSSSSLVSALMFTLLYSTLCVPEYKHTWFLEKVYTAEADRRIGGGFCIRSNTVLEVFTLFFIEFVVVVVVVVILDRLILRSCNLTALERISNYFIFARHRILDITATFFDLYFKTKRKKKEKSQP